ncbi:MAG TPA: T9SS type A sorting domain-containing protein [Chitinophagales bacterium]|nr:T9SS type A sorting domain-containing protein [Chitinophagales bacterium]
MKVFFSLLLLIFFASIAQSQDFAPVGAKWWYSQGDFNNPYYESFSTIESVKDTLVANQTCRKLLATYNIYFFPPVHKNYFMYGENRKIFYFSEDSLGFLQLYDFNKEVGDSFLIEGYYTPDQKPLKAYIDSVDSVQINLALLKRIYTHTNDGLGNEFSQWSIEGIGNLFWMFPWGDFATTGPLRCYQDSILGLYETGILACDYVAPVNEIIEGELFSVFPNPAHDFFYVNVSQRNFQKPFSVSIRNPFGKLLLSKTFSSWENVMDARKLAPGIYFLELKSEEENLVKKFEKQ